MSVHRQAFEDFAERVSDELEDSLDRLILFGSVARGEAWEESDVDVLVVVEDEEDIERVEELAFDVSAEYGVFIVPVVKSFEEFSSKKDSSFIREVERTGEPYVKG